MKKTYTFRNIFVLIVLIVLVIVASTTWAEAQTRGVALTMKGSLSGNFEMGNPQIITWSGIDSQVPQVDIRLIRKVSSNPARYEVVRTIAENTPNDGYAVWIPSAIEANTSGLSIEIGCGSTSKVECRAGNNTDSSLAVVRSTRYGQTASIFRALEALNNR